MSREWVKKRWPKNKAAIEVYYYEEKMLAYLRDRHSVPAAGRLLKLLARGNPLSFADYFEQQAVAAGSTAAHNHNSDDDGDDDDDDGDGDGDGDGDDDDMVPCCRSQPYTPFRRG